MLSYKFGKKRHLCFCLSWLIMLNTVDIELYKSAILKMFICFWSYFFVEIFFMILYITVQKYYTVHMQRHDVE